MKKFIFAAIVGVFALVGSVQAQEDYLVASADSVQATGGQGDSVTAESSRSLPSVTELFNADRPLGRAVVSGFLSKHINAQEKFNEQNHGIGYRSEYGYFIGYYKNSIYKSSFYAGREFQWHVAGPVRVGVMAGVVTGYYTKLQPVVLPEVVVKLAPVEVSVTMIPAISGVTPLTIATQVRILF